MSAADYAIVLVIGVYLAWVLFGRKKRGCCGDCRKCKDRSHHCH